MTRGVNLDGVNPGIDGPKRDAPAACLVHLEKRRLCVVEHAKGRSLRILTETRRGECKLYKS